MRLGRSIALLLAPDLHDIARRVKEAEKGLGVVQANLAFAQGKQETHGLTTLLEVAKEDVAETRYRLLEVHAILTGRRDPDKVLNGG